MKKIFVFLLLMVVSFALKAQYPIQQNLGGDSTIIYIKGAARTVGGFINGTYTDTAAANLTRIRQYEAAQIFTTNDSAVWIRTVGAKKWVRLGSESGGSGANIYNSDGSLTGNRILSSVGHSLQFTGLSNFLVDDVVGELVLGTSATNRLRVSSGFTAFLSLDADSLLMTRLPQSQLLSTDSVLIRTADFKVKTRAVGSIGGYTAGNGLTLSGSQFKLGSPLTEPTTITGDATNKLVLQGYNASNDGYLNIGQDAGYLQFGSASFTPSYESEIYSGNIELGLRTSGNIYLDARDIYTIGVPTVSSTTGRKVALIDTATGKVERIDPATLVTTPSNIYYTSQNGCVSDADLSYGSSTFGTDNTAALQAILDNGGGSNPITVIVNGRYSATQLKIKSNTRIIVLPGCGFIQRDNSDKQFVVNYNRSTSIVDSNITIQGGIWNFNGYRSGARQTKEAANGWVTGFRFAGVKNVIIRDVLLYNPRTFASFVSKFKNVVFENIFIKADEKINQDGLKFLVGEDAEIKNINGESLGDDILSICANDIFWIDTTGVSNCGGAGQFAVDSFAVYGTIKNITADGIISNSTYGVRLLSSTDSVRNVTINNFKGNVRGHVSLLDNYTDCPASIYGNGGSNSGFFSSIYYNDISVKHTSIDYKSGNIFMSGKFDNISFSNISNIDGSLSGNPYIRVSSSGSIENLKIDNYTQKDVSSLSYLLNNAGGTINNLSVSNSVINRDSSSTTPNGDNPFLYNSGFGTVNNISLSNVKTYNVRHGVSIVNGTVKNINAVGIYHKNSNSSYGFINSAGTVDTIVMSNYNGKLPVQGSGLGSRLGDAFPDTISIATFTAGSTVAGDTTAFATSVLYGSFYHSSPDTLYITGYRAAVQGSSASIILNVWFNDSLNVEAGGTKIVNSPSATTSTTTGDYYASDNSKIAPGNWIWVKSPTVTTKPTYMTLTLIGYRKRK